MSDRIELSAPEELLWEGMRDDDYFERQCTSVDSAGERCAFTIHLTGLHTWETPGLSTNALPGGE